MSDQTLNLLPCPFCGTDPTIKQSGLIECPECLAYHNPSRWNRRPSRSEMLLDSSATHAAFQMAIAHMPRDGHKEYVEKVYKDIVCPFLDSQGKSPKRESGWQSIESAPKGKILILWADMSGADFSNWKMATGSKGYDDIWYWDGQRLDKPYHLKPTHWMPIPSAPSPTKIEDGSKL